MFGFKRSVLSFAAAAALLSGSAFAADWDIDPTHSSISFSIDHMVISEVEGSFNQLSGVITGFEGKDAKKAGVEVTVQVDSIDTNNKDRDDHLRGPDFFDAAQFPTATFKSKRFKKTGEKSFDVVGDLTLHGVTKEITVPMTWRGPIVDPWGNTKAGFTGNVTLNRADYGLTWNKTLETGGLVVGDEVRMELRFEAAQRKDAEAK